MLLESTTLVVLTLTVIVSGAITRAVVEALSPRLSFEGDALVVQLLVYGTIPFAIALALYGQLPEVAGKPPSLELVLSSGWNPLLWLAVVLIIPLVQAAAIRGIWAYASKKRWFGLEKIPTAWDRLWFKRAPAYVVVAVEHGDTIRWVGGEVAEASTAARLANGGDLFIEQQHRVSDGQPVGRLDPPRGVWLAGDTIKEVQMFWTTAEVEVEHETKAEQSAVRSPLPQTDQEEE